MIKTSPIFSFLNEERNRQKNGIELIASENYVSKNLLEVLGSEFTNKYAEGYPGKRYYEGCSIVDKVEAHAITQAQELFDTDYFVNVQPHSGSSANMAVYLAVQALTKKKKIKVLGLSLDGGGHLTHGAFPSFSGLKYNYFDVVQYEVGSNGKINMVEVADLIYSEKPDLIIAGASAYSSEINFKEFSDLAKKVDAYLLVDMAHIAGLVAVGEHNSPFGLADFITSTTHKTLRGPRGGIIFSQNKKLAKAIDSAIFPGIQGGPHIQVIAAKAICFEEAQRASFKTYIQQVKSNAKIFEEIFKNTVIADNKYIKIVGESTENHLLLLNFQDLNIPGKKIEKALEDIGITTNKNSVPGDVSPVNPGGLRIGTPAITSRGIKEDGIKEIANIIIEVTRGLYNDEEIDKQAIQKKVEEIVKDKPIYPIV